jgi:uncharacterized damage-inducible protein DinB
MSTETLARESLAYARTKLTDHLAQVVRCVGLLGPDELWQRANAHTNSVGNLVLHLTGNVRQWIVGGLGGEQIERDRPAEFAERGPLPAAELLGGLEGTVGRALEVLAGLNAGVLEARHTIQGYGVSGLSAVFHVVEHFAFHTGQIVHMTKVLKDVDLSLYDAHGHKRPGQGATP